MAKHIYILNLSDDTGTFHAPEYIFLSKIALDTYLNSKSLKEFKQALKEVHNIKDSVLAEEWVFDSTKNGYIFKKYL